VTARVAAALGVKPRLLPATDDRLRTVVETPAGACSLQEWFVKRRHADPVDGLRFEGAAEARPAPGVLEAIERAGVVVIAPSNPYISIWPILAVESIRAAVERSAAPTIAISPVIGGQAVKGPAAAMLERLAGGTSPVHVAGCYPGLIDALVVDEADAGGSEALAATGVRPHVTRTLMTDRRAARLLAEAVLDVAGERVP
jgi:LPPG:FO 2-phospho-L-lactate transferase